MPKEYQKKPGYLGNANLKPIGVKIDFTKQQVEEYVKCANDPVYFGRNYVKVVTLDHGISNFDLYDYQEKLIRTLEKNRFVIGKLSRQAGKTTTVGCCYLLHKVLFNQNMNVCILANKLNTARDILSRIRESYEHLPTWLQQGIVEWNKGSIVLENGSKIVAAATSSSAVRGGSYNCISGTSIITIKDNLTGEIYNISIEDFYSNSSRNTDYYKNFNNHFGKQMQEMLYFSHQNSKILNRWEVLTADGFKSFRGISKTHNRATIKLLFDNNSELICTEDHKIATNDGFIEAKKLNKNHEVISSNNILHLVDIINDDDSHVYDLLEVTDTHSFFANNILVHNCIFLDEFAFVPTTVAEEFFSSVYPTITAGQSTQMIIISTPKGLNMYYQLWKAAISKQSEYVPFEVSWRDVPQYPGGPLRDDVWKEQQIKNTSERQFDAEYNCSFIGSANTLIDANKLNQLSYGKPRHRNGEGLVVYQDPIKGTDEKENPDHQYFITVDVARGQGKDNSAFVVFDITTMPYRIVARFKSNVVSPLLLPSYIRAVGKKYNNAYVLVEVNDIGSQVADILHNDLEYENLIKSNFKGTKGQTITEIGGGNRLLLGVRTTNPVKKLGCAILKNLIEQDKMVVDDSDTIDELTTFIADGVSFRADEGHTDDLVMCLVLFSWATRQDFFETLTNKDIRVEMFNEEIDKIEAEIVPFGFIEDGRGQIGEVVSNDVWFDRNDRKNNISTQFWIF